MNITSRYLEAAIIDQKVAGAFRGLTYCFVSVVAKGGYQLGVAVANEKGYNPIDGKVFTDEKEARQWAQELNEHIGRANGEAVRIVVSTMGGQRYEKRAA